MTRHIDIIEDRVKCIGFNNEENVVNIHEAAQKERKPKVENKPTETIRQEQEESGPELRKSVRKSKPPAR